SLVKPASPDRLMVRDTVSKKLPYVVEAAGQMVAASADVTGWLREMRERGTNKPRPQGELRRRCDGALRVRLVQEGCPEAEVQFGDDPPRIMGFSNTSEILLGFCDFISSPLFDQDVGIVEPSNIAGLGDSRVEAVAECHLQTVERWI
ncbi:MAG: hypothetical protein ACYC1C_04300, partial [Chloroflexota bacterium]